MQGCGSGRNTETGCTRGLALFSNDDTYYIRFSNVSGLATSSPVYANGYRVGVVRTIDYDYSRPDCIIASFDLDPKMQLHEGTRAEIVSDFMGNVKLELQLGAVTGRLLAKGDTIEGGLQGGLMTKAAQMVPKVEALLPKLVSILAGVQTLVTDPAISATLQNAEQLTASLNTTARQLNQLTAQLNRQMPQMMDKAQGVLDNTATLTGNLAQLDLQATMQRVDQTLANVQQLTAALNSPHGTVGMLLNDAQLYQNITATMRDVDSLLVDFKAHPRRYINVSVFGKKSQ